MSTLESANPISHAPTKPVEELGTLVSIVIPCRNEEKFIGSCLETILNGNFPRERLEILVVDGMSQDGTRAIVRRFSAKYPFIQLLDNPKKIAPAALNIGIAQAKGEFIMRIDAHAEYPNTYITNCLQLLETTGAANAGGRVITVPNGTGPWAVSIAWVTSHRFGVGNSAFRTSDTPGFVDTVPFGTFRRPIFKEIGLFDERLTRNQDNELNARIRRAGYKIAFDPAIRVVYRNQATLSGLIRQAFFTGMWNVYTLSLHPYSWQWRRFVPAAFVIYLLSLIPFWVMNTPPLKYLLAAPLLAYAGAAVAASIGNQTGLRGLLRTAFTFFAYHFTYGLGSLYGILNLGLGTWRHYLGKPLKP